MTALSVSAASTRCWPNVTRLGSGEAPRTPSAGRSAGVGGRRRDSGARPMLLKVPRVRGPRSRTSRRQPQVDAAPRAH